MKHPTKKEEKKIQQFLKDFQWMFGVQNYTRTLIYSKDNKDEAAAEIRIDEDYQRIRITIYPCFFENTIENQREYLLHEFCHYLTDPIAEIACDLANGKVQTDYNRRFANEKSTSRTTNIIDKLLTDNLTFAKRAYATYLKK